MTQPTLDKEKCTACGLCAEVCGLDVIVRNENGTPTVNREAYSTPAGTASPSARK